jgi:hypothetical protein
MCMMLYIGSDETLPLVPWDETAPGFYVAELLPDFADVCHQFSVAHVYYSGSHEGCGCGFQLGEYPDFEDDEAPAKRESLRRLAEYLDQQLVARRKLELFACWAGSETSPATHHRRLHSKDFTAERFFFLDGELSIVEQTAQLTP